MKTKAVVAGAHMTRFGRHPTRSLKDLAAEAIRGALADAGIEPAHLQAAYMGNAAASVMSGQVLIPGQVVLRAMGIGGLPVINVENACATSATAFEEAVAMVEVGRFDIVLVAGYEKLVHPDKARTFSVFQGAVDVEAGDAVQAFIDSTPGAADLSGAGTSRSLFMDIYATAARRHMMEYGTSTHQFALVAAKNSRHGALNPNAQFRDAITAEAVLAAPMIAPPLTLPMCSPIGDGAAALIVMSEAAARRHGVVAPVRVRASELASGWDGAGENGDEAVAARIAAHAYAKAGIGPEDIDLVELHDATAPAELIYTEHLGFAPPGGGGQLVEEGATTLGGRIPVNPSGGLLRKGHPIGASGAAQIVELVDQLRGRAGARQVEGARLALAENGGGFIGTDVAAIVISILEAESQSHDR